MSKPSVLSRLIRLSFGFVLGLFGLFLYIDSSHEALIVAFFAAFLSAFGLRWFILGIVGLLRPLPARKITVGVALLSTVVLGLAGPGLSTAYHRANEPKCWEAANGAKNEKTWQEEYSRKIPVAFRRPEYLSRVSEAICADGLAEKNFFKIRFQAENAFVKEPAKYDDQARKVIGAAWRQMLDDGLKSLKPSKLADPKMTAAFQQVLKALEEKPTRRLLLHFKATGTLQKMPQDQRFFASLPPQYAKLPVLPVGDAFGAEAHARRSRDVIAAMQHSFDSVWPKGMMQMDPAPSKPSPDDVNFWVEAKVHRIPGFYTNTEGAKITSLLYKCDVTWSFRIEVKGKEAGSFRFRSEPAKHVSYSTRKTDPKWAPYSIIMDSAADNFARLILGRLGLTPPPVRDNYSFSK